LASREKRHREPGKGDLKVEDDEDKGMEDDGSGGIALAKGLEVISREHIAIPVSQLEGTALMFCSISIY